MRIFESNAEQDTYALAYQLGRTATPGMLVTLDGDLGVGKTVFAKGIADALEIPEAVSSPTFTIVQEYHSGRLPLYHFDVYRIGDPEEMDEIGYEDYFFGDGVCLIEWSTLISELIPEQAIRVFIEKDPARGFSYRRITVRGATEEQLRQIALPAPEIFETEGTE